MEWMVAPPLLAIWLWPALRRLAVARRRSTPIISIGIDHGERLKTQFEEPEDEVNGEQTIWTFKSKKRANQ
jgi:hypothetical protein